MLTAASKLNAQLHLIYTLELTMREMHIKMSKTIYCTFICLIHQWIAQVEILGRCDKLAQ